MNTVLLIGMFIPGVPLFLCGFALGIVSQVDLYRKIKGWNRQICWLQEEKRRLEVRLKKLARIQFRKRAADQLSLWVFPEPVIQFPEGRRIEGTEAEQSDQPQPQTRLEVI